MEQRSQEWHEIRRGRFTASDIYKLVGTGKKPGTFGLNLSDWSDTAQGYIMGKVAQSFSSQDQQVDSKEMRWGREHEPEARAYYEGAFNCEVQEIGFVLWPENNSAGCSPDGLIVEYNRGLEIKCPFTTAAHLEGLMLRSNADLKAYSPQYYWQVMSSLMFTGLPCWDFVSYHPYFFPEYRMSCIEIIPDKTDMEMLAERIHAAVKVRDKLVEMIKK